MAERLGNRASNQKVARSFAGCANYVVSCKALHPTCLGECPCTYCKLLWIRASTKCNVTCTYVFTAFAQYFVGAPLTAITAFYNTLCTTRWVLYSKWVPRSTHLHTAEIFIRPISPNPITLLQWGKRLFDPLLILYSPTDKEMISL